MKTFKKQMRGVTLLEIMLVLAVAAMITITSVRYYQSATQSQQFNAILQQIQAITASADQFAQGTGNYKGISANIKALLPNGLTTPWAASSSISVTVNAEETNTYSVTIPNVPVNICTLLNQKLPLISQNYVLDQNGCASVTGYDYVYNPNPQTAENKA